MTEQQALTGYDDFGNRLANWPLHPAMHVGTRIDGEWWHHIPWEGWSKMRPNPFLNKPTKPRPRWRFWRRRTS